jgi:hypothetical protein
MKPAKEEMAAFNVLGSDFDFAAVMAAIGLPPNARFELPLAEGTQVSLILGRLGVWFRCDQGFASDPKTVAAAAFIWMLSWVGFASNLGKFTLPFPMRASEAAQVVAFIDGLEAKDYRHLAPEKLLPPFVEDMRDFWSSFVPDSGRDLVQ